MKFSNKLFERYAAPFLAPRTPTDDARDAAVDFKRAFDHATFNGQLFSEQEIETFNQYFHGKNKYFPDINDLAWANNYFELSEYERAQRFVWDKILRDASEEEKQHWIPYLNAWLHQGGMLYTLNCALANKALFAGYSLKESKQDVERGLGRKIDLSFKEGTLWITERVTYDKVLKLDNPLFSAVKAEEGACVLKGERLQAMKFPLIGTTTDVEILPAQLTVEYQDPALSFIGESLSEKILDHIRVRRGRDIHEAITPNDIDILRNVHLEIDSIKYVFQTFESYCQVLCESSETATRDLGDDLQQELDALITQVVMCRLDRSSQKLLSSDGESADMELWMAYQTFKENVHRYISEYKTHRKDQPSRVTQLLEKILEHLPRLAECLYKLMGKLPPQQLGFFKNTCALTAAKYHAAKISHMRFDAIPA